MPEPRHLGTFHKLRMELWASTCLCLQVSFCASLCLPTFLGKVSLEKIFLFQVNQSFLPVTRKVTGRRNKPVCQEGQASRDIQDPNQGKWQKGLHWFLSNKHHFQDNRQCHRIRAGGLCSPGDTKLH